jgi:hypothetical protein
MRYVSIIRQPCRPEPAQLSTDSLANQATNKIEEGHEQSPASRWIPILLKMAETGSDTPKSNKRSRSELEAPDNVAGGSGSAMEEDGTFDTT